MPIVVDAAPRSLEEKQLARRTLRALVSAAIAVPTPQPGRKPSLWARMLDAVPHGRELSQTQWDQRHRAILILLIAYAAGLVAFGRYRGYDYGHLAVDSGGVLLFTLLAAQPFGGRRLRSALASFALLSCAALGVHLSGGRIEAHFAFFVVISILMLYQDWLPFLIAIAYVVGEHGIVGVLIPASVYANPDAQANPWAWAAIHGAFVVAASAANLVHWRLSEDDLRRAQRSDRSYRRLFSGNPQPMWVYDVQTLAFLDVNDAAVSHYGYTREEFLGMTLRDIRPPEDIPAWTESINSIAGDVDGSGPWRHLTKRGDVILARISAHPVHFGDRAAYHAMAEDVTERESLAAQLRHQAFHDPLTGLPNRALLLDRLYVMLQHAQRSRSTVAVLFCDLDGFKPINDSLGHGAGDELLRRTGERFTQTLRAEDTLSRVGGDEFVAVCEVEDEDAAMRVAGKLCDALEPAFVLDGHQVRLSVCVGIALATGDAQPAEELVRNADIAMYRAKRRGRGGFEIFDASMYRRALQRLALEQEMRPALGKDEFRVHYQPLVCAGDRGLHSFEALVRWQHPEHGLVPPLDFIGIAEDSGFILTLGAWVLGESCRQLSEWSTVGMENVGIGINLSARQLADAGLCGYIESTLEATGVRPEALVLEVTESVLMANVHASYEALAAIKELGIGVSIDDFGTGYSSLAYLSKMPLDFLKIDGSFVREIETNDRSRIVASTVVDLAAKLAVRTVAEGVETEGQAVILEELGCDLLQGFHLGRPEAAPVIAQRWAKEPSAA